MRKTRFFTTAGVILIILGLTRMGLPEYHGTLSIKDFFFLGSLQFIFASLSLPKSRVKIAIVIVSIVFMLFTLAWNWPAPEYV